LVNIITGKKIFKENVKPKKTGKKKNNNGKQTN
jgi:hypothetical protein